MINDLFEMPFAFKKDVTFSSVIPLIIYNEGLRSEDYYWLGRTIDINKQTLAELHRYKFLEYLGDECIERVLVTDSKLDPDKDWSKDETPVLPVYSKRYNINTNSCHYDRYLGGCWGLLDTLGCMEDNLVTVHEKIFHHLNRWRDIPGLKKDEYFDKIITGKSSTNLETFRAELDCTNLDYDWDQPFYNQLLNDPEGTVLPDKKAGNVARYTLKYPEPKVKDLNPIKSRWCGLWCMGLLEGRPTRLFDPNGKDVQYSFQNEYSRWEQIGVYDFLFWSNLTDVYLDFEIDDRGGYKIKDLDILNRYTGYHVDRINSEHHQSEFLKMTDFITQLSKMALELPVKEHKLDRIRVQLNWWDEIFIEFYIKDQVFRFFIDSTVWTLADPCIMQAWG